MFSSGHYLTLGATRPTGAGTMCGLMVIGTVRNRVVVGSNPIGPIRGDRMAKPNSLSQVANTYEEVHSLQDGATLGAMFGLSLTYPLGLALILFVLFVDSVSLQGVTLYMDNIFRKDEIRSSPEYFVGGFLSSSLVVGGVASLVQLI